ncbi:hypothetical protein [Nocardia paucivorans]|uniref:hypothetical protein n=1 Tax=Nocardia paucivorans TaxID=114259 RepID=UPI001FE14336|nr:hypothetical protein [Nocardia paucivorans]
MAMEPEPRQFDSPPELELVRDIVLARRRQEALVLAALEFGSELLRLDSEHAAIERAVQLLARHSVDETEIARDPHGALRADMLRDRERIRRIAGYCGSTVEDESRRRRLELLYEVRADLQEVVQRCRRCRLDRVSFTDEVAHALGAVTDKLASDADMDTYHAWQRGMLLKLTEEPRRHGPPRVLATVDAGPGREPLVVEWDSCERRLALIMRMMRAGVSPLVICDRLLADLSVASPLRYSRR